MPAPLVPIVISTVARLVAKHGTKQVQRALKAANKPAKGSKASKARARGADYQAKVDRNVRLSQVPDKMARDAIKLRRDISKYNKKNKGRGK